MADLRAHDRHTPAALTYVSAGSGNGGILLNLSEAGCALQLVAPPQLNTSIELELDLGSEFEPVHATGVAVWIDDTGCTGIRFVDLPQSARTALRQWLEATREPEQARPAENPMVALTGSGSRFFVRQLVEASIPNLTILSHSEIPTGVKVLSLGVIQ